MNSTINKTENAWQRHLEPGIIATLDWRMARQALPSGAVPLMAFGGAMIDGEYFTADEVQAYLTSIGWKADDVVIFERVVR